jgi:hypothetical protein
MGKECCEITELLHYMCTLNVHVLKYILMKVIYIIAGSYSEY